MLNYQTLLMPNDTSGSLLIDEVMAIAEIFPKDDAIFLVAYVVKTKKAKSTPYRKPIEFSLSAICDAINNFSIGTAMITLPGFMMQSDDQYNEAALAQREHRFAMVAEALEYKRDLYYRHHGDKLIQKLADKYKIKRDKVQELLNDYYRAGRKKNGLMSHRGRSRTKPSREYQKLGRNRVDFDDGDIGKNVFPEDLKHMKTIGRAMLLGEFSHSYKYAYDQFLTQYHSGKVHIDPRGIGTEIEIENPNTIISFDQFYRNMPNALEMTRAKINKKRHNKKNYDSNFEAHIGTGSEETFGPGHIYQMDSTELDLELVCSLDRSLVLGIVTLYVIRDVYTFAIVGVHIGVGKASYKEARLAIFNTFRNKKLFANEYGIDLHDNDWIESGSCQVLLIDNEEIANNISEGVAASLGIEARFSRTYRGDDKGLIESAFHIYHSLLKRTKVPGFKYKGLLGRNRFKPKREASLTVFESMKLIIIYAVYHNKSIENKRISLEAKAIEDEVLGIPRDVWVWGVENRFYAPCEMSEKELYLKLLETVKIIPKRGVFTHHVTRLKYTIQHAIQNKELLDKSPNSRLKKPFVCRYLRQTTNYILVEIGGQFHVAKLHSHDRGFKNLSFSEVPIIKKKLAAKSRKRENEEKKALLGVQYDIRAIADNAKEKTKKAIEQSVDGRKPVNSAIAKELEAEMADVREVERINSYVAYDVEYKDSHDEPQAIEEIGDVGKTSAKENTYENSMNSILQGLQNENK